MCLGFSINDLKRQKTDVDKLNIDQDLRESRINRARKEVMERKQKVMEQHLNVHKNAFYKKIYKPI